MKTIINFLLIFEICILLSACNNHSNIVKQVPPVYSLKIKTKNVSKLNLLNIASLDKIIPLETNDECLITSIGKVFVTDSSLIVWDKGSNNVFIFDNTGRYQHSIGNKGPSPEEYINIGDVQMNNDTIQLLDVTTRRIINYNISGKFISSIKSDYYLYTFYMVPEGFWGINVHQNKEHYNLILLDKNLQRIKQGCFVSDEILPLLPTNNFSKNEKSDELIFHYQYNDTIYKIQRDSITPFIALDFGKNENSDNANSNNSNGHIHNVHLYGDHLFFSFNHASKDGMPYEEYNCHISLKKSEIIIYTFNIIHDERTIVSPLPEVVNISKGKLIYQIVPGELPEQVFNKLKESTFGNINSESNPILILYNLQE